MRVGVRARVAARVRVGVRVRVAVSRGAHRPPARVSLTEDAEWSHET